MRTLTFSEGTTLPEQCLAGRVILIVGAAGGFGSATARAAARAGATVVLLGRRVAALERVYDQVVALGAPQPAIYPLDLSGASPAEYESMADAIREQCGRLDGLVHAAAHFAGLAPLPLTGAEEWVRALHVNLTAPWLLTQACLPLLEASGQGQVVHVIDDAARVNRAYWGGYGVAKSALMALSDMLALELENKPISVTALRPGPMRTGLRAQAYIGENPGSVPTPDLAARACVHALAGLNGGSAIVELPPAPTAAVN